MESFFKWVAVVICPAIGFTDMLKKASKEDAKKTVIQFTDTIPKAAGLLSKIINIAVLLLSVFGFLYIKKRYFGGRRAFR